MLQFTAVLCLGLLLRHAAGAGDWPTFGHDPQRTGWASSERILTAANIGNLELKWRTKLENTAFQLASLTAPIVAAGVSTSRGVRNVVYVAGNQGTVFALDTGDGSVLWTRKFISYALPNNIRLQGSVYCPNGINATPVFDGRTGILYVLAEDGALYGLDSGSGKTRFGPVQFVASFAKSWSLNLAGDTIYTVLAQGCGGALAGFYSMDIRDPHHTVVRQMLLSNTNTGGIWGRGGPVIGTDGRAYGSTADGPFDPIAGDYSNSVVAVSLRSLSLADYFTPLNWRELHRRDLDFGGASPVWFAWRNYHLLASGAKEGVLYLLDAASLGSKDHQTPLFSAGKLGNDANSSTSHGIWGGLSMWRDEQGDTWIYVPMYGPPSRSAPEFPVSHGPASDGSVMAFKVAADARTEKPMLVPAWISRNLKAPDPVAVANGVVFALATGENVNQRGGKPARLQNTQPAVLYALDGRTGQELYNSGSAIGSWVHFSGLAIAEGRVFSVDYESQVYCFGLKGK
ncbi:MAG TPA: PQQ-binding-like beta-propeller repeat protein [Bryobacteraceae bacterium]|nr:PQQ-binding-like beta-propeller repeat protein [Bryobacteraceae bacterium]